MKPNGIHGDWWGDPAISGDGSTCAVVGKHTVYIFDAKTGEPKGQVEGNRHKTIENSNEVSFSQDGSRFAMVAEPENLRVHSWNGNNYNDVLLDYTHKCMSSVLS